MAKVKKKPKKKPKDVPLDPYLSWVIQAARCCGKADMQGYLITDAGSIKRAAKYDKEAREAAQYIQRKINRLQKKVLDHTKCRDVLQKK